MTTNPPVTENKELKKSIKEFNDTTNVPAFKFESERAKALNDLMDGMRGLYEKQYSPQNIALEIRKKFSDHPLLSKINGRNVKKALGIVSNKNSKKENVE